MDTGIGTKSLLPCALGRSVSKGLCATVSRACLVCQKQTSFPRTASLGRVVRNHQQQNQIQIQHSQPRLCGEVWVLCGGAAGEDSVPDTNYAILFRSLFRGDDDQDDHDGV